MNGKRASDDRRWAADLAATARQSDPTEKVLPATAFLVRQDGHRWAALNQKGDPEKWFEGADAEGQARNFAYQQQKLWEMKHSRSVLSARKANDRRDMDPVWAPSTQWSNLSGIEPQAPQSDVSQRPHAAPQAADGSVAKRLFANSRLLGLAIGSSIAIGAVLVCIVAVIWRGRHDDASRIGSALELVAENPRSGDDNLVGPHRETEEQGSQSQSPDAGLVNEENPNDVAEPVAGSTRPNSSGATSPPIPKTVGPPDDGDSEPPGSDASNNPRTALPSVSEMPAPMSPDRSAAMPARQPTADAPMSDPASLNVPRVDRSDSGEAPSNNAASASGLIELPSGKMVNPRKYAFNVKSTWSNILKDRRPVVLQQDERYHVAAVCDPRTKALDDQATILSLDGAPRFNAVYRDNSREGLLALWNEIGEIVYYQSSRNDKVYDLCCLFHDNDICLVEEYDQFERAAIHRIVDNEVAATYPDERAAAKDRDVIRLLSELKSAREQANRMEVLLKRHVREYIDDLRTELARQKSAAGRDAMLNAIHQRNAASNANRSKFWTDLHRGRL